MTTDPEHLMRLAGRIDDALRRLDDLVEAVVVEEGVVGARGRVLRADRISMKERVEKIVRVGDVGRPAEQEHRVLRIAELLRVDVDPEALEPGPGQSPG